jgi:nitrous oxide reductase accessory protein NosL
MKALARLLPVLALLLSGCGYAHDEKLTGPYRLIAVDVDEQMDVSYSLPNGGAIGRIPETVFSVGWNDRYIVAKQHPKNNRSITNYYYLDMSRDSTYADPSASVAGPLKESDFLRKRTELSLPDFSRTIKALQ